MDKVDLNLLTATPTLTGSVQKMYSIHEDGKEYLLCEAVDDGSVFDVGRFFVIPGSGRARNTMRHQIFAAMRDPARWRNLEYNTQKFSDEVRLSELFHSGVMNSLKLHGADSHHVGSVDPTTGQIDPSSSALPSSLVLIERVPVIRPLRTYLHQDAVYDYTPYAEAQSKVIALEQIVRLGIPGGSAIINRFRELGGTRSSSAAEYIARYGVKPPLESWSPLSHPICDWQTKYEDGDRNLEPQEALYISGLSAGRLTALGELLMLCSLLVDSMLSVGGLKLWDLKWEAAVRQGAFLVADTMDHDSMRVTYPVPYAGNQCNIHFNKQAIRDYCKVFHQEWVNSITEAKRVAKSREDNRPFMDLYRQGVAHGDYPPVPSVDPAYTDLMALKYQYVTDVALRRADEATGLSLAQRELTYYESRGRLDALVGNTAPVVLP